MTEVDEDTAVILAVFLYSMVQLANFWLVEEAQDALFELAASLARNNLHQGNPPVYRFLDDPVELRLNFVTLVVDVV